MSAAPRRAPPPLPAPRAPLPPSPPPVKIFSFDLAFVLDVKEVEDGEEEVALWGGGLEFNGLRLRSLHGNSWDRG